MSLIALAFVSAAFAQTVGAEVVADEQARFAACAAKIETDAEAAYETALTWSHQGNRPAARHCLALSMIGIGRAGEGAGRLEQLANARDGGTLDARAVYLVQAGHAWIQAGAPDAAVVAFTNALKLNADAPDILVDRAGAYVLTENLDAATRDLDTALKQSPGFAPAHQLRARVRLEQGKPDLALEDVKAALTTEPTNIETLVLRGRVREAIRLTSTAPASNP
jgi:tetratricopeptide (TPR) repeat protein